MEQRDIAIVGAGHNGLVAATLLGRRGLAVAVLEEQTTVGGACRTEYPFPRASRLGISSGAYLLGLMPPELLSLLGARIELIRRDPHYFLPTLSQRYLLFGSDRQAMHEQFLRFFSQADWRAEQALAAEIGTLRDDLAPSWLAPPLSVEETAARYIRPALRRAFVDLVTRPVEEYLWRFGFESELLLAMHAVTDGFPGASGGFGTPGTGMNFLVHNMCRLPGSDGTFMIVRGGMGRVTQELARLAREAGAEILTATPVVRVLTAAGAASGVVLQDGRELRAKAVLCNCDPFRMRELVGRDAFPADFNARLDGLVRPGTTLKVNLALARLPVFKCLPEDRGQHDATIHLLPQLAGDRGLIDVIRTQYDAVQQGRLAELPTIEWYIHSRADPSLRDEQGRHNAALFVQWVPYEPAGTTWEREAERYARHLLGIADAFAPGFSDSVVDMLVLTPKAIEQRFGIRYGHIHHIDNRFGFDQRVPYRTPLAGLYSCSAGCHPAGSVIGAAGHNAAAVVSEDLTVRDEG